MILKRTDSCSVQMITNIYQAEQMERKKELGLKLRDFQFFCKHHSSIIPHLSVTYWKVQPIEIQQTISPRKLKNHLCWFDPTN